MGDYWEDRCPRCWHARKWHGEGGCNCEAFVLGVGRRRCGCYVGQTAFPPAKVTK